MADTKVVLVTTIEATHGGGLVVSISHNETVLSSLRMPAFRQAANAANIAERREAVFGVFMAAVDEAIARVRDAAKKVPD